MIKTDFHCVIEDVPSDISVHCLCRPMSRSWRNSVKPMGLFFCQLWRLLQLSAWVMSCRSVNLSASRSHACSQSMSCKLRVLRQTKRGCVIAQSSGHFCTFYVMITPGHEWLYTMQDKVTDLILGRLNSAPVADLPAMLQHLLLNVSSANARQVSIARRLSVKMCGAVLCATFPLTSCSSLAILACRTAWMILTLWTGMLAVSA